MSDILEREQDNRPNNEGNIRGSILPNMLDQLDIYDRNIKITDFIESVGAKAILLRIKWYYKKEYNEFVEKGGI